MAHVKDVVVMLGNKTAHVMPASPGLDGNTMRQSYIYDMEYFVMMPHSLRLCCHQLLGDKRSQRG